MDKINSMLPNNFKKYHVKNAIGIQWHPSWDDADIIILNGEGTMHHSADRPATQGLLEIVKEAQRRGITTILINSLWQDIEEKYTEVVQNLDYFSVRDVLSQQHATEVHGRSPDLFLDLSYTKQHIDRNPNGKIGVGRLFSGHLDLDGNVCDIFTHPWPELIQIIADSDLLVTGRHHEMYAACIAKTPFVVYEGNSWKNQGLLVTADVEIPVLSWDKHKQLTEDDYRKIVEDHQNQYEKLFDFMENYPESLQF